MPTLKIDVPYFQWREGRPRWIPGPRLRERGWRGRDLKDELGGWLLFEAALDAARAINEEVRDAGPAKQTRRQPRPQGRSIADLLEAYFASRDFDRRRPNTKRDYRGKALAILFQPAQSKTKDPEPFAAAPAAAITPVEVKAFFEYLERQRSLGMARGAIMVLSAAYRWGRTSSDWRLRSNPCHRLGLPAPAARIRIATDDEIRALVDAADAVAPSIGDAVYLGLFTGQRQADILELTEPADANRSLAERVADGEPIEFRQAKTGAPVKAWPTPQLVVRLAGADRRRKARRVVSTAIVVCETTGIAWGQSHFQHSFADIRATAAETVSSVTSLQFRDLRDTAVTWLARAGATIPEIADITGHSLGSVTQILKHYLAFDGTLGRTAIAKLTDYLEREGIKL